MSETVLPRRCQVLIVGAGPTGLSLAIGLRQQGVDCLVIDRAAAPSPWSRALGLHACSLEHLYSLGVLDQVRAASVQQTGMTLHNARGVLADIDLTTLESRFPWVLSCPQPVLEDILAQHYLSLGGRLVRGVSLASFSQLDREVTAQLQLDGESHELVVDLLVGCDGADSEVRRQLGFAFDGEQYPDHFLLCDTSIDWDLDHAHSHAFFLPGGALLAMPMPGGWRLVIDQPLKRDTHYETLTMAPFVERLQQAFGEAPALAEARWLTAFSIHRRLVSRYRLNRVLLAGDACHIQSPVGAQGMNTGIADACNLAWKMALFLEGIGGGHLLDSYEAERRPVARAMVRSVDWATKGTLTKSSWLRGARDQLLKALGSRQQLASRLVRRASQLDVNYRESPIVGSSLLSHFRHGPHAGDRAPDALFRLLSDRSVEFHLQDLFSDPRHYLLMVLPVVPEHADIVAAYALADRVPQEYGQRLRTCVVLQGAITAELRDLTEFDLTLLEPADERFASRYGSHGGLWLLRPDGHLALRCELQDGDSLLHWLERFFTPQ